jgi:hypothetical protein
LHDDRPIETVCPVELRDLARRRLVAQDDSRRRFGDGPREDEQQQADDQEREQGETQAAEKQAGRRGSVVLSEAKDLMALERAHRSQAS